MDMRDEMKVVRGPLPEGFERLPATRTISAEIINVLLPDGTVITNPESFWEDEELREED